ncbi:LysR family transcriptional regulator [Roseibium sp.]|uniref:LysR family transcriptional regulator n=1 Tax=Roseibium sp. TaxID=1936156 RepID=UPI003A9703D9
MDVDLARTFLQVVASGNFYAASQRLNVTQSAVSLRIKRLEELLGVPVFIRNKAGAHLTPAGEQFERFARSFLRVWEEARYQVTIPEGFTETLIIGSQYSLWPNFGLRWLRLLERMLPETAFRAEIGMPDRLTRMMLEGLVDIALMYTPQIRPGLGIERLMEDQLVLVSMDPEYPPELDDRYVFIDWGPEFVAAHKSRFRNFRASRTTLAIGAMALDYVVEHRRAAYFPARVIEWELANRNLHIIADAPVFPFPAYCVYQLDKESESMRSAISLLKRVAEKLDEEQEVILDDAGAEDIDRRLTGQVELP